jgi:hypothetical protein
MTPICRRKVENDILPLRLRAFGLRSVCSFIEGLTEPKITSQKKDSPLRAVILFFVWRAKNTNPGGC